MEIICEPVCFVTISKSSILHIEAELLFTVPQHTVKLSIDPRVLY